MKKPKNAGKSQLHMHGPAPKPPVTTDATPPITPAPKPPAENADHIVIKVPGPTDIDIMHGASASAPAAAPARPTTPAPAAPVEKPKKAQRKRTKKTKVDPAPILTPQPALTPTPTPAPAVPVVILHQPVIIAEEVKVLKDFILRFQAPSSITKCMVKVSEVTSKPGDPVVTRLLFDKKVYRSSSSQEVFGKPGFHEWNGKLSDLNNGNALSENTKYSVEIALIEDVSGTEKIHDYIEAITKEVDPKRYKNPSGGSSSGGNDDNFKDWLDKIRRFCRSWRWPIWIVLLLLASVVLFSLYKRGKFDEIGHTISELISPSSPTAITTSPVTTEIPNATVGTAETHAYPGGINNTIGSVNNGNNSPITYNINNYPSGMTPPTKSETKNSGSVMGITSGWWDAKPDKVQPVPHPHCLPEHGKEGQTLPYIIPAGKCYEFELGDNPGWIVTPEIQGIKSLNEIHGAQNTNSLNTITKCWVDWTDPAALTSESYSYKLRAPYNKSIKLIIHFAGK